MNIIIRILLTALALVVVAHVVPGITVVDFWPTAVIAAVIFGVLNVFVKPILVLVTIPVTVLTLGLFYFILNGFIFLWTASIVDGFVVNGFGSAFWGALVMSLIGVLFGTGKREVQKKEGGESE